MAEYIKREDIKFELWSVGSLNEPLMVVRKKTIDSIPAADVAPVRHGRCEFCNDGKTFIRQTVIIGNDGRFHMINYCPNCGARMDGAE